MSVGWAAAWREEDERQRETGDLSCCDACLKIIKLPSLGLCSLRRFNAIRPLHVAVDRVDPASSWGVAYGNFGSRKAGRISKRKALTRGRDWPTRGVTGNLDGVARVELVEDVATDPPGAHFLRPQASPTMVACLHVIRREESTLHPIVDCSPSKEL